jgi:sec-independent protein translocase protein TatC
MVVGKKQRQKADFGHFTSFISDYIFTAYFGPPLQILQILSALCDLSNQLGLQRIFVTEMPLHYSNNMEGQMNVLIWTCITAGFILGLPFILWEIWKFISPALYTTEKHAKLSHLHHRPFYWVCFTVIVPVCQ